MAVVNKSAAGSVLQEMIADDPHSVAAYDGNPTVALAKKIKVGGGHPTNVNGMYVFEIQHETGDNTSYTPEIALLKRNVFQKVRFTCGTVESFNALNLSFKALREVTDEHAFVDLLTNVKKDLDSDAGEEAERGMFKHEGNALGQVGSFSGSTLTLKNPADISKFKIGSRIRTSASNGLTGSLRPGVGHVIGRDENAGTLKFANDVTAELPNIANNDYIFMDGSFGNGRQGLPSWIPDDPPSSSDNFNGVNRSVNVQRLAGHRITASGGDIATALRAACAAIRRSGAKGTDVAVMSVDMRAAFCEQQEQKVHYETLSASDVEVGIDVISFNALGMKLKLVDSWACPDDRIYLFQKSELEIIHSTRGLVELVDDDGAVLSRNNENYDFDIRTYSVYNYVLRKLHNACVIKFS